MLKKIITAVRRAKAAGYVASLQRQLKRLEAKLKAAKADEERTLMTSRIDRKQAAIRRAKERLAALCALLMAAGSTGCAHGPKPVDAIETAVVVAEGALAACKAKHKSDEWDGSQRARDARAACLQVDDIDRARDASTALDDAVEGMEDFIKTGS